MKNKIFAVLLSILLFYSPSFAQNSGKIGVLLMREYEKKDSKLAKYSANDEISVLLYPQNKNSDNINTSYFTSRNIKYTKSRNYINAKIPRGQIKDLESLPGLEFADISYPAEAKERITEGRDAINATNYVINNISGEGIKIAVVDIGFKGFNNLQTAGELPLNLITKDFTDHTSYATIDDAPTIDPLYETELHGSACAEIVYDIVPKAQIYLIKIDFVPSLQNAYDYCVQQGIRIVSGSIGWSMSDSFVDGTSSMAKIVQDAYENDNILSVFAAGNEAEGTWVGDYVDSDSDGFMNFPSGKNYLDLYIYDYGQVGFMWDDFTDKNSRYDLYIYDRYNNFIEDTSSLVFTPGVDNPIMFFLNDSGKEYLRFKIKKVDSNPEIAIKLSFDGSGMYSNSSDKNPVSSLSSPGDARGVISVGAINVGNWSSGPIDYYSSHGPTRALRTDPLNYPETQKPDIVAPSYVTTKSYGIRNFNGTSAATPHVAASAALLLSIDDSITAKTLREQVISYAKNILTSPDNTYGKGKLVLDYNIVPLSDFRDVVCYPNPASISKKGYVKITNFPYKTSKIDVNIYTITGEFVKHYNAYDIQEENGKRIIMWDLKNQSGSSIAPGVYFIMIDTISSGKIIRKIAIQK